MTGGAVLTGAVGNAAIGPTPADVALALPALLVAVTVQVMFWPMSAETGT